MYNKKRIINQTSKIREKICLYKKFMEDRRNVY